MAVWSVQESFLGTVGVLSKLDTIRHIYSCRNLSLLLINFNIIPWCEKGRLSDCFYHTFFIFFSRKKVTVYLLTQVLVSTEFITTQFGVNQETSLSVILQFIILFQETWGSRLHAASPSSSSSSSNSPSSSAVASWYCWYSDTRSFMLDSAFKQRHKKTIS